MMMMTIQRLICGTTVLLLALDGKVATGFSTSGIRQTNAVRSFVRPLMHMTATSSSSLQDPTDIFRRARDFALADDLEFEEHYHPYRDYEQKLHEANGWLTAMAELPPQSAMDQEQVADIVARLQKKAKRYEKRMHKDERANSVIPSIALELSLGALVAIVAVFWTTLDMNEQHGVTPLHFQDWLSLAQEKGYLVNMFDFGRQLKF